MIKKQQLGVALTAADQVKTPVFSQPVGLKSIYSTPSIISSLTSSWQASFFILPSDTATPTSITG